MNSENQKTKFMIEAISLAAKGFGKVAPNPMVGAVIVKDGEIIGRGYHRVFGSHHAEINALRDAGARSEGADIYITLEPCNSFGKKPPCSQEIIKAGIKRVFFACKDPAVTGSKEVLEKAGIEVIGGICEKKARKLIKDYLHHLEVKPRVSIKAAISLDGKIASKNYDSKWITSEISRDFVHKLRSKYDAVLIGANTARLDNPHLTSHGKGKNPIRAAIIPQLNLKSGSNLLNEEAASIIFYDEKIKTIPPHFRKEHIFLCPINVKKSKEDFSLIIDKMHSFGIKTILIEGGGEIISSALFSNSADDLYFFIAPKIIGGKESVSVVGGIGAARVEDSLKISEMRTEKIGGDLLITGKIKGKRKS
ncbi:MAG: bifunctional diaminohydroxyphosphoribosylaminopyrimidine deaminase/5-amino-6-(5-phosphoribosylamino)uracil reductase RibD [Elusimicrobiota bacterium]|jgi:diaminohydroxyphosphoribosylaminopyrimidine deaminase/5-amino-6-(5-phosphoribosylamino)uracil reductase|nr:bifunctional diaminohydroxyphosphoribosylaminopyrimidine deaminase/5-amino-6-(5-phosphoribosylamino)uracil reductase RibD [Elusimicrobiota bacterium]